MNEFVQILCWRRSCELLLVVVTFQVYENVNYLMQVQVQPWKLKYQRYKNNELEVFQFVRNRVKSLNLYANVS